MQGTNPAVFTKLHTCVNAGRRRETTFNDDRAKEH